MKKLRDSPEVRRLGRLYGGYKRQLRQPKMDHSLFKFTRVWFHDGTFATFVQNAYGAWTEVRSHPRVGLEELTNQRKYTEEEPVRMWMVDPSWMCRAHLLGEHRELHAIRGLVMSGKSLVGYTGLIEPRSLVKRHGEIVCEMLKRGYQHETPMSMPTNMNDAKREMTVDRSVSEAELLRRCPSCRVNKPA